eukprot:1310710-Pleurochrysis_carterae.AAC.1
MAAHCTLEDTSQGEEVWAPQAHSHTANLPMLKSGGLTSRGDAHLRHKYPHSTEAGNGVLAT